MNESYVLVGYESGRLLTILWLLTTIGIYSFLSIREGRRPSPFVPVALTIWIAGGYFAQVPMGWMMGGAALMLGLAIPFLSFKDSASRWSIRWICAPGLVVLGLILAFTSPSTGYASIELRGDRMLFSDVISRGSLPRSGLRIDATGSKGCDWYSWSTSSGYDFGPHLAGYNIYLGPHGLIRGDDLGRRIAKWSGSTPKYKLLVLR